MPASRNLRFRLLAGALLPLIIAVAGPAVYTLMVQRDALDKGLDSKARTLAGLVVKLPDRGIKFEDDEDVAEGLALVAGDPDVEFAEAVGPMGEVIAFRGNRAEVAATLVPVAATTVRRIGSLLVIASPVVTDGHQVGTVFLGLRSEALHANAEHMAEWVAGISIIGILVAVIVVLVLAGRIVRDFKARARMEFDLREAQRLETIGRLAAGIAHEINTPIQFISDSLEFVQSGIGELTQVMDRQGEVTAQVVAGAPARATIAADADVDVPYLREQLPLAVSRALEGIGRVTAIVRSMKNYAPLCANVA